jgi:serine/threonine protein phosphatase PrpC
MEDSLLVEYDESNGEGIFAVFDGHNGRECAVFLQKNYGEFLRSQEGFLTEEKHDEIESAMKKAAVEVDSAYLKAAKKSRWSAGSTGIVAFCRGNNLWVSNTGDSRAVAIVDGKPLALSVDQKPDSPDEKKRCVLLCSL